MQNKGLLVQLHKNTVGMHNDSVRDFPPFPSRTGETEWGGSCRLGAVSGAGAAVRRTAGRSDKVCQNPKYFGRFLIRHARGQTECPEQVRGAATAEKSRSGRIRQPENGRGRMHNPRNIHTKMYEYAQPDEGETEKQGRDPARRCSFCKFSRKPCKSVCGCRRRQTMAAVNPAGRTIGRRQAAVGAIAPPVFFRRLGGCISGGIYI